MRAGIIRENLGWLKKMGFPKDAFRLLCFNCNMGRRLGPCPHEEN